MELSDPERALGVRDGGAHADLDEAACDDAGPSSAPDQGAIHELEIPDQEVEELRARTEARLADAEERAAPPTEAASESRHERRLFATAWGGKVRGRHRDVRIRGRGSDC